MMAKLYLLKETKHKAIFYKQFLTLHLKEIFLL